MYNGWGYICSNERFSPMKKYFLLFLSAMMLTFGCYDDTAIRAELDNYENRISELETFCNQFNTNISALEAAVTALQSNVYITSVVPVNNGSDVIGYVLSFNNSESFTIYHGEDGAKGEDGVSPIVGVREDIDGVYYWTLNGEWMIGSDGYKIQASGTDGNTPKLKIEGGYWYVSYDGGKTWETETLGQATGDKGYTMFEEVTYDANNVYITMAGGEKLVLLREIQFGIVVDTNVKFSGTSVEIPYTIECQTPETVVECMTVNCTAVVLSDVIAVTGIQEDSQLIVFADNGSGKTSIKKINLIQNYISVDNVDHFVPCEGGNVLIGGYANVEVDAIIPTGVDWISVASNTKSGFALELIVLENKGDVRSASIDLVEKGTSYSLASVVIVQNSNVKGDLTLTAAYPSAYDAAYKDTPYYAHGSQGWTALDKLGVFVSSVGVVQVNLPYAPSEVCPLIDNQYVEGMKEYDYTNAVTEAVTLNAEESKAVFRQGKHTVYAYTPYVTGEFDYTAVPMPDLSVQVPSHPVSGIFMPNPAYLFAYAKAETGEEYTTDPVALGNMIPVYTQMTLVSPTFPDELIGKKVTAITVSADVDIVAKNATFNLETEKIAGEMSKTVSLEIPAEGYEIVSGWSGAGYESICYVVLNIDGATGLQTVFTFTFVIDGVEYKISGKPDDSENWGMKMSSENNLNTSGLLDFTAAQ